MSDLTTPAGRDELRRYTIHCRDNPPKMFNALGSKLVEPTPGIMLQPADLLALLDQADAGEREWRAIESAPKDGTRILAYGPYLVGVAKHFAPPLGSGRWLDDSGDEIEVTHWMPLPSPPPPARAAAEDDTCHCGLGPEDHKLGGAAEHNYVPRAAAEEM